MQHTGQKAYRPDIDGLRCIAVLSVILFHATGATGGFIGVDIFFVISGFLISRIIFREADEGRFSIGRFYERRIRRIIPALTAMIVVTAVVFAFFSMPVDYKSFGQSVGATAAFLSNLYFYLKSDYFDPSSEIAPLLHTWSLAVEEQYYLVFPLLAVWFTRVAPGWRFRALTIGFAASLVLSIVMVRTHQSQTFYLPFTRVWELFIGAMVATIPLKAPATRRQADLIAAAGVVLILVPIVVYTGTMLFPGESALPPCLGAALLLFAGQHPEGRIRAMLSARPIVFIGLISYSLYLWHWPVLVGLRYVLFRNLTPVETLLALALMLALAYGSWRWVEQPFREQIPGKRLRLFATTAAIGAAAILFAGAAQVSDGFPGRFPQPARDFAAAALDINPRRAECDRLPAARIEAGAICTIGADGVEPSFVFIGDSFSDALMPAVDEAAKRKGKRGYALVHSGCFPLAQIDQADPSCRAFTDASIDFVQSHPDIRKAVLVARWTSALLGNRFGQVHGDGWFITDAESKEPSYAENVPVFGRGLTRMLESLAPADVSLIAHIPEQRYDVPRALAMNALYGTPSSVAVPRAMHEARQAPLRTALAEVRAAHPFGLVDVGAAICGADDCPVLAADGRTVLYADDNHLSRRGGEALADLFAPALDY